MIKEDKISNYKSVRELNLSLGRFNVLIGANVQIDTNECEQWNEELKHIGDNESKVKEFINDIIKVLIKRIGQEYER